MPEGLVEVPIGVPNHVRIKLFFGVDSAVGEIAAFVDGSMTVDEHQARTGIVVPLGDALTASRREDPIAIGSECLRLPGWTERGVDQQNHGRRFPHLYELRH